MELTKVRSGEGILPGNISIPLSCDISLLHAAVFANDEAAVKRLLSLGADPKASSIVGSALELALNESTEARENESNPEAVKKLKNILEDLRKAAAASPRDVEVDGGSAAPESGNDEAETSRQDISNNQAAASDIAAMSFNAKEDIQPQDDSKALAPAEETMMMSTVTSRETSKRVVSNLPAWMASASAATPAVSAPVSAPCIDPCPCGPGTRYQEWRRAKKEVSSERRAAISPFR